MKYYVLIITTRLSWEMRCRSREHAATVYNTDLKRNVKPHKFLEFDNKKEYLLFRKMAKKCGAL